MERNTEKHGNEKYTLLDLEYGKNNKENEKPTWQDVKYGEKQSKT